MQDYGVCAVGQIGEVIVEGAVVVVLGLVQARVGGAGRNRGGCRKRVSAAITGVSLPDESGGIGYGASTSVHAEAIAGYGGRDHDRHRRDVTVQTSIIRLESERVVPVVTGGGRISQIRG